MTTVSHLKTSIIISLVIFTMICCTEHLTDDGRHSDMLLSISGDISQQAVSRANDSGFTNGDMMGIYVVDYNGNTPGQLQAHNNRATNVCHTFNENEAKWTPSYDIYWKDDHTHTDIYAYYPYSSTNPTDVNNYPFSLQRDQSKISAGSDMGGYEASDFLWGKAENITPTASTIRLSLSHILSSARVTLTEGTGFNDAEWESLQKQVLVANTRRECTIDLASGNVNVTGGIESTMTIPANIGNEWRAIVLPQKIAAGTTIFSITIEGTPYKFYKSEDFIFEQGKLSNFTIRIDKTIETGKYHLTLIGESITDWENDLVSHDASAREYLIINSTPGGLRQAINAAGKDYAKVKNLKITGRINATDFYFMRDNMDMLQSLNLHDVTISACNDPNDWGDTYGEADRIPAMALHDKTSLLRIILPEKLKTIAAAAFDGCLNLSGSLDIPEGVTHIEASAFCYCFSLTGSLTLPSTLEYIGGGGSVLGLGAFHQCGFISELKIPESVTHIGINAFADCKGLYGELRLPSKLKYLGTNAFLGCQNLTGSLSIPETLTFIGEAAFQSTGLDGNLYIPDGVVSIGRSAFAYTKLRGELSLPKSLQVISNDAFAYCDFSGELILPSQLSMIGSNAFAGNWRLSGTLMMPETMQTIGSGAFRDCRGIEGVVFNSNLETICANSDDGGAFCNCFGIGSIVCLGSQPPLVQSGAFDGVPKDNFTLEVPEYALTQYQTAKGWTEFKRISAHHELVCRPAVVSALSTEHKQTLTINAESDWEVADCPSWCTVSPSSGTKKTIVTLTVNNLGSTSGSRDGIVTFRLKDKDYTHSCAISQHGYQYGEDEILTLQHASQGQGVNVVFLGDGFNSEDISNGTYLKNIKQEVEYFFGIEPYATYRKYFNIYTMFPLSAESGVGTVNSIRYNRFSTTFTGGVGLRADYDDIFSYVEKIHTVNSQNINQTLIVIIPNSTDYGGITQMWDDGRAIAFCPMSNSEYPYDTRGVVQHEAGGHGFGKLADECIYHNAFIDFCGCACCPHAESINYCKALGWYDNISLTNKTYSVPWSHLITDVRYNDIVDVFEGAFMHSRGVFRSEQNSCMNNDIPYFSTISRESIVRRIKQYAGETFSFEDFVANDKQTMTSSAKAYSRSTLSQSMIGKHQMAPVLHKVKKF